MHGNAALRSALFCIFTNGAIVCISDTVVCTTVLQWRTWKRIITMRTSSDAFSFSKVVCYRGNADCGLTLWFIFFLPDDCRFKILKTSFPDFCPRFMWQNGPFWGGRTERDGVRRECHGARSGRSGRRRIHRRNETSKSTAGSHYGPLQPHPSPTELLHCQQVPFHFCREQHYT